MPRVTETIGFSVPPPIARRVERMAKAERRTKSELFREMVRVYERYSAERERFDASWVKGVIEETQAEERRHPTPPEVMKRDSEELRLYGIAQTKKLGLKTKDVDTIIHAHRARRKHAGGA
jgi:predicted transcriptional regulator